MNGQWIPSSSGKFFDVTDSNTGQAGVALMKATGQKTSPKTSKDKAERTVEVRRERVQTIR